MIMRDSTDNALVVCNMKRPRPRLHRRFDRICSARTMSNVKTRNIRGELEHYPHIKIGGCNVQLALDPP